MCWTYFKTIGHTPVATGKGDPANLFVTPWKNLLGVVENYWT